MSVSRLGLWTGLFGGIAAAVGAAREQPWSYLVVGLVIGLVVSVAEAGRKNL